jgi:hypothetical protein
VIGLVFNGTDRPFSHYYGGYVANEPGRWWGGNRRKHSRDDGAE